MTAPVVEVPPAASPVCGCGGREVRVVFKCPVHVVVADGEVVRVVVARDCAEGPIVAECASCGASDVDGDEAAATAAEVAEASAWPPPTPWGARW